MAGLRSYGQSTALLHLVAAALLLAPCGGLELAGLALNGVPLDGTSGGAQQMPMAFVPAHEELRLSWDLSCDSCRRGDGQATYSLSLLHDDAGADGAGAERADAEVADGTAESARVVSTARGGAESAHVLVAPAGALQPDTRYRLRLSVTTALGSNVTVTTAASFHTALGPPDWNASSWIGGYTSLRSEFELAQPPSSVASAALYVTGVGCFQASLNGALLSDTVLDPGFSTSYTHRVLYRAFAVEKSLLAENAIGIRLGFSKYGYMDEYCTPKTWPAASDASCRALNLQLRIAYADGSTQLVTTAAAGADGVRGGGGGGWQGTTDHNPVTYTHIYHGEKRDDRLLQPGWDSAGFAANAGYADVWQPATPWAHAHTLGALTLHTMPPIGPTSALLPVSKTSLDPEVDGESRWLFDFGVNRAGFSRINASSHAICSCL